MTKNELETRVADLEIELEAETKARLDADKTAKEAVRQRDVAWDLFVDTTGRLLGLKVAEGYMSPAELTPAMNKTIRHGREAIAPPAQ